MAVTPCPSNAMLAASGMNFGVRRTVPHILGIAIGLLVLLALFGFGLGVLFNEIPHAKLTLSIIVSVYLAYLAWRIANAGAS
jgi:threonine/homoserine/homoserine lactone efflux protein